MKTCDRCHRESGEKDFRGSVCGWCADDLESLQQQVEVDVRLAQNSGQPEEEPLF